MPSTLQPHVVDLHKVLVLALLAIELESKDEALSRLAFELLVDRIFRLPSADLVIQDAHDLAIRTLWAEEEEIVGSAGRPLESPFRNCA